MLFFGNLLSETVRCMDRLGNRDRERDTKVEKAAEVVAMQREESQMRHEEGNARLSEGAEVMICVSRRAAGEEYSTVTVVGALHVCVLQLLCEEIPGPVRPRRHVARLVARLTDGFGGR